MLTNRNDILQNIKRQLQLHDGGNIEDEKALRSEQQLHQRLTEKPKGILPKRGQGDLEARQKEFISQAEKAFTHVELLPHYDEIPRAICQYIQQNQLPLELRHGHHPLFNKLPWQNEPALTRHVGASNGDDLIGLSIATWGIAETGTLLLTSGKDNPTTLNFLPDVHMVILANEAILSHYEEGWAHLHNHYGDGNLPRMINYITGPSRSADIEQTLLLGAHGPRKLVVFIVETMM